MGKKKVVWTSAGWYQTKKAAQKTAATGRASGHYARVTKRTGGGYDVKFSQYKASYYR